MRRAAEGSPDSGEQALDALFVDDIQFLVGREAAQDELRHVARAHYSRGRQVVVSAGKPPEDLPRVGEHLRDLGDLGLIAELRPPSLQTRLKIVRRRAEAENLRVPEEVAQFLAASFATNVRELLGALTRLGAVASLAEKPMTIELAETISYADRSAR